MSIYPAYSPTSLYAGDYPRMTRAVTVASGSNASGSQVARGTLLGRVTATDKYIPCVKSASDGSQNPVAIAAASVDASAADQGIPAYFAGHFEGRQMVIDASWTLAQVEAALRIANAPLFINDGGTIA